LAKKSRIIGSVQRAINILDLFSHQNPELGTTEIAMTLDLPKSTVAGLVFTLDVNGYLDQNPENRKYRLGLKLLDRGKMLIDHLDVRRVSIPFLEELRDWCNESVNLAVLDGMEVVYVERMLGTSTFGIPSEIGKREPVHSTALGKAILSYLPVEQVSEFIDNHNFDPKTPKTITDRDEFLEDLQKTRTRGYAIDDEENEIGGRCIAAPVFDYRGKSIASVSISIPVHRFPVEKIPLYGENVKRVTGNISQEMGYLSVQIDK
jgi:DNA-binding IclR family transcriptional regulator